VIFFNSKSRWLTYDPILKDRAKAYKLWMGIRTRVTNLTDTVAYSKVSVDERWLDYQNFADWFYEQDRQGWYVSGWELDKDMLSPVGGKIYSPNTCVFLPKELNNIFVRRPEKSECCLGVNFNGKKYQAVLRRGSLPRLSKCFYTEDEAFDYYKFHKEAYIEHLVNFYADKLPEKVIQFFSNYEVNKTT